MAKIAKQVRKDYQKRFAILRGVYPPETMPTNEIIRRVRKMERKKGWYWNAMRGQYFSPLTKLQELLHELHQWCVLRKERRERKEYIKLMKQYGKHSN